ncbi:sigma 54-interacting transcriptional regulator [Archangium violaceum]|uniref:sigma-54-dependent transcriptional regulator n=1 Tax=Archangium violaceum TaxID=83451 RepID=UPI00194E6FDC|nr:sigma 54-interacting transcriptional regulator [Archangium violaceum]QRN97850.1 sigma 54-interacting transcriptional regulator [Archangium violaceum]
MSEELSSFFAALHTAKHFEEAASEVLRAMLLSAERTLETGRFARRGRLLRGVVHVRPDDAYRRLAVLEMEAVRGRPRSGMGPPPVAGQDVALLASASAWRAVAEQGKAVAIDVNLKTLQPLEGGGVGNASRPSSAAFNPESQRKLLGRQATHVCVFPLRVPGGRIDGMIALEADCMAALGQEFVWKEAGGQLQLLADMAAAWLTGLPPRPVTAPQTDDFLPVIGASMASLVPVLRIFAQQEETILVSGPTGAGKSRLARWCHERSGRRQGRFESLDLTTVPEDLQMAELFGWRRGAFTGAVKDNPGSIARAEGGTVFIDEIDKLSLKAQAGLLHVLEERTYRVLGEGSGDQRANVRFIIGTNANLREAVRRGAFREDLYYRINVLPIRVPPLNDRQDEIPLWARYMVGRRHQETFPGGEARLEEGAERLLLASAWPGNLRQLDNIIRRAYTLAMVDQGGAARELELREKHVRQALAYEGTPEESTLVDALCHAARVFVQEARRRQSPLDIDLAESFRGFVLGMAAKQVGKEEAFRLVGREALVKSRNHQKTLRRELEKVEALCREVAHPGPEFLELLSAEGGDSN